MKYFAKTINDRVYLCTNDEQIGEISKDAIWVKDGDTFEEEDVRRSHFKQEPITPTIGLETKTAWGDRVKMLSDTPDWHSSYTCEYLDEAHLNHSKSCVKGGTYNYHLNNLGYTDIRIYKILCPTCKTFH